MRYFRKFNGKVMAFAAGQLTSAEKSELVSAAQAALDASEVAGALRDAQEELSEAPPADPMSSTPQTAIDAAVAAYESSTEYAELQRVRDIKVWIPEDAVEMTPAEIEAHLNPEPSKEQLDAQARAERDMLFAQLSARFERNASEARLGLDTTDDISALDVYAQSLRDITEQTLYPYEIEWPTL